MRRRGSFKTPEARTTGCVLLALRPVRGFVPRRLSDASPVPDQRADIKLVIEDASAALTVAVDRAWAPRAAQWSGNVLGIQFFGESPGI